MDHRPTEIEPIEIGIWIGDWNTTIGTTRIYKWSHRCADCEDHLDVDAIHDYVWTEED